MSDRIKIEKLDRLAADVRVGDNERTMARKAAARLRNKPPVLQHIIVEVARPRPPSFHGRVEEAKYAEVDGFVQLYSMEERSLGRKFRRLIVPPLNARETASILLRSKVDWKSSSFSRPLVYPKGF
jgi:hypothetical protein